MADGPTSPKRVCLTMEDIESLPRDELLNRWKEQEMYVNKLEEKRRAAASRGDEGKESEEKLKQQHIEAARRENTLVMRLTSKEQELQEYMTQIQEMKTAQSPSTAQLRSMLLDPAVNLVFTRMQKEMKESKEKLEQTQNELSAWRFTPDSQTGKRLMAKCRMLYQENEELGKVLSSGKIAKLEGEIALEKTLVQEMKKSQAELDEFLGEIDEDVEGMQSMICVLQQQLKDAKEQVTQLTEENRLLKADRQVVDRDLPMSGIGCGDSPHRVPVHSPQPWQAITEPMARCEPEEIRSPSDPATLTDNHLADEVEAGGGEEGMEVDSVEHRHDTADSQPETPPLASSPRTIDTPELTEPVTASSNHTTTNSQASPPATPHTDSQPSPQAASPPPRSPGGRENGAVRTKEGDRDPEALAGGDAAQDKVHNGVADSWQQGETTTA